MSEYWGGGDIGAIVAQVTMDPDFPVNRTIRERAELAIRDGRWRMSFVDEDSFRRKFTESLPGPNHNYADNLPLWLETDRDVREAREVLLQAGNEDERIDHLIEVDARIVIRLVTAGFNGIEEVQAAQGEPPRPPDTTLSNNRDAATDEPVITFTPLVALQGGTLQPDRTTPLWRFPRDTTSTVRFGREGSTGNPWLHEEGVCAITSRHKSVSGKHCEICKADTEDGDDQWLLRDVGSHDDGGGSTNGTLVIQKTDGGARAYWCQGNDFYVLNRRKWHAVDDGRPIPIVDGDVICIAPTSGYHMPPCNVMGVCYKVAMS